MYPYALAISLVATAALGWLYWRERKGFVVFRESQMIITLETTEALNAAREDASWKKTAADALNARAVELDELKKGLDVEKADHKKTADVLADLQRRFGLPARRLYTDAELIKAERQARLTRGLGIDMSNMMQDARKRGIIV